MFRRFVLAHANFVVKIVRPTNKTTRGLMKLCTAFLISSLAHYLIDSMALETLNQYGAFKFWMSQIIAIILESAFMRLYRRIGTRVSRWTERAVGYVWVVAWFSAAVPFWVEPVIRAGFLENGLHFPLMKTIGESLKVRLGVEG
jgi:hypothetical protein